MRYIGPTHYLYAAMAGLAVLLAALPSIAATTSLLRDGHEIATVTIVIASVTVGPALVALAALALHVRDTTTLRRVLLVRYEFHRGVLQEFARPVRFSVWRRPVVGAERLRYSVDVRKVRFILDHYRFPREGLLQLWDADPVLQMNFIDGEIRPTNRRARPIGELSLRHLAANPDTRTALQAYVSKRPITTDMRL